MNQKLSVLPEMQYFQETPSRIRMKRLNHIIKPLSYPILQNAHPPKTHMVLNPTEFYQNQWYKEITTITMGMIPIMSPSFILTVKSNRSFNCQEDRLHKILSLVPVITDKTSNDMIAELPVEY